MKITRSNKSQARRKLLLYVTSMFILAITLNVIASLGSVNALSGNIWQKQNVYSSPQAIADSSINYLAASDDGSVSYALYSYGSTFVSSNRGQVWREDKTFNALTWYGVDSSSDGSTAVAIGNDGSGNYLAITSDSGSSWSRKSVPSLTSPKTSISPDGSRIYVYGNNTGNYVYQSTDGGNNWTAFNPLGQDAWASVASSSDGSVIVAANSQVLYISTDSGASWSTSTSTTLSSGYWVSVAVSNDASHIVASSTDSLYTSTNSGATWSTFSGYSNGGSWQKVDISADGTHMASLANNQFVYTSSDSGSNWVEQANSELAVWADVVVMGPGEFNYSILTASFNDSIYISDNFGQDWTNQAPVKTTEQTGFTSIAASLDGSYVHISNSQATYLSDDSGDTWSAPQGLPANSAPVAMSSTGQYMIAAPGNGAVYISNDYGSSWNIVSGLSGSMWNSISMSDDGSKIVLSDAISGVYVSNDYGSSWSQPLSGQTDYWSKVAISGDGNTLYAFKLVMSPPDAIVLVSTDHGESWNPTTVASTFEPWMDIATSYDGSKAMIVSQTGAIYLTEDSSQTWQELASPNGGQWASITATADFGQVAIGDYAAANVYTTNDLGQSWNQEIIGLEDDPNNPDITTVAYSADGLVLFASSQGSPLFKAQKYNPQLSLSINGTYVDLGSTDQNNPLQITGAFTTIKGKALPNADVSIEVHSDPIYCNTTANSSGDWTCTFDQPIPDGQHSIFVTITDPTTEISYISSTYYFNLIADGGGAGESTQAPNTGLEHSASPLIYSLLGIIGLGLATILLIKRPKTSK